ncbi:MAG: PDZ domain-containing protein [Burkholderiaceae bacterium]
MIEYRIAPADPRTHHYRVTLRVNAPAAEQALSLPVWIPGSYLVREFARHLSGLQARQGTRAVRLEQTDKARWVAHCRGSAALEVSWRVYAFDTSVRAAFLDERRGFFNATSLCLRVEGREAEPHAIELVSLPRGWQVATAMPVARGARAHRYESADYDELVDHPFELGTFWRGRFTARGVPHEFVVAGAWPGFDGERLLADTQRICETQIAFWHGARARPPFRRYVFMLQVAEEGHGGLEHRASTALLAARRGLPRVGMGAADDAYVDLLGLISHEYFHTWHVKRMRPREFARYDYERENYTRLLWLFEGGTSYYDDLLLLRAGLIEPARYLRLLAKAVNTVRTTPGRQVQSVADASFDAWVKFYRVDENTPNATVSYYTKGALVALALDLTLRREGSSLDAVMRQLWRAGRGGPIDEAAVQQALAHCAGRSLARELARWVHGTQELPLQPLLEAAGVQWSEDKAAWSAALGLRLSEGPVSGIQVKNVLAGSAAARAGISVGDELLAVNGWRLRRLDDAQQWLRPGRAFDLTLVRDQRLHTLTVRPQARSPLAHTVRLGLHTAPERSAAVVRRAWLGR